MAEQMTDPEGLDTRHPRLSWRCQPAVGSPAGARQTAYRITVASSAADLRAGRDLLWDSTRVVSGESVLVPYAGQPLSSGLTSHWQVTIWDEHGRTAPSAPARWSTGLAPADWIASWIGGPAVAAPALPARWIGYDNAGPNGPGHGGITPGHTQYFRRRFDLPDATAPQAGSLLIAVDGSAAVFVNGVYAGAAADGAATRLTLPALPRGRCVIALQIGHRPGITRAPAVTAWAVLPRLDGGETVFATDADWRVADWAPDDWRAPEFDDAGWSPACTLPPALARAATIDAPCASTSAAIMLRRVFTLDRPARRAWLQASGLGWSEFQVNGTRLGDTVLSPPLADYDRRVPSVMHDVTALLQPGANALGALLGRGRFAAPRPDARDFGPPRLRLQLMLDHADGTRRVIASDTEWQASTDGPLRANNEYDGETYDARREQAGWATPRFDASAWPPAQIMPAPAGRMVGPASAPSRVLQRLEPLAIHAAPPAPDGAPRWIADFGQNHAGVCRLRLNRMADGAVVTVRHAERLRADGSLDTANLRSALATDRVIGAGAAIDVQPRFTTHGFRYAEITGLSAPPPPGALQSAVIGDDLRPVGRFTCSDDTLNAIVSAACWSIRSNCRSIRTDCPQRDERQGWLGDPAEDAAGEAFLFDNAAFYAKWLDDIADTQRPDGALDDVAPAYLPLYMDDASWPTALPAIADMLHRHYADAAPLRRHLPVMTAWLDHLAGRVVDGRLPPDRWGDWGAPEGEAAARRPASLIATAYLARSLTLVAALARRVSAPMPPRLTALATMLRASFHDRFFDAQAGVYGDGSVTAALLPLAFDLVPPAQRDRVAAYLIGQIEQVHGGHVCFGLIGCQWINRVLTGLGRADLALQMAVRRDGPGLGAMIGRGATTLWELWGGPDADPAMSSDNHTMLMGDLITWLFSGLAGIRPDADHPGFARFTLAPTLVHGLDELTATHDSVRGPISSAWRIDGRSVQFAFTVPPGSVATFVLPPGLTGRPSAPLAERAPGRFEAQPGRYEITARR